MSDKTKQKVSIRKYLYQTPFTTTTTITLPPPPLTVLGVWLTWKKRWKLTYFLMPSAQQSRRYRMVLTVALKSSPGAYTATLTGPCEARNEELPKEEMKEEEEGIRKKELKSEEQAIK